ncbi:MAG: type II secretion system protein [Actinobacteria bacterium]|nr:MAG: type II secretion system protein [Actinomycetota bacterium]
MLKNKKGSGFVELMVALTILNIVLLALIPSFIFSTKSTLRNNVRTTAYNLGIRQLERVKSLDYDDVGLTNSN